MVPVRCISTGMGSAASALRCITMPTGFCSRTALCAARIARGRPSVIGSTIPGNKTMPRTGTTMRESAGSGGEEVAPGLSSGEVATSVSVIEALRLVQRDQKATVEGRPVNSAVAAGGKTNPALETALRKLKAVDDGGLHFHRKASRPREDQIASLYNCFNLAEFDAGQGDQHE